VVVTVCRPGLGDLAVRAAVPGEVGQWPFASADPVHVVTAWNPGGERPGEEVNRRRQAALETELRPTVAELWPARGLDPLTGAEDEGVAVQGVSEGAVRAAGLRYRQDAIFVWTSASWSIVACAGDRRVTLGWALRRHEQS
jgi:hypothetical protein